jgi:hypothetical protein
MARLLERLPSPSVKPSRREQVAGIALFLVVSGLWTLWLALVVAYSDVYPSWSLTHPLGVGGLIAAVPSAASVVVAGYLLGRTMAAVQLGWIPGALMIAVGFMPLTVEELLFTGGLLLIFGWPVYFLPLIAIGAGLRSWHVKRLELAPRIRPVNRRLGYGIGASVVVVGLLAAGFYARSRDSSEPTTAARPVGGPLCTRPGLRYAGATRQGAEVCFTLSPDRREWVEIGASFVPASGCPNSATGTRHAGGPVPLDAPGRITIDCFTATIRGEWASGVLSDSDICGSKTFAWTARRGS